MSLMSVQHAQTGRHCDRISHCSPGVIDSPSVSSLPLSTSISERIVQVLLSLLPRTSKKNRIRRNCRNDTCCRSTPVDRQTSRNALQTSPRLQPVRPVSVHAKANICVTSSRGRRCKRHIAIANTTLRFRPCYTIGRRLGSDDGQGAVI